MAGSRGIDRPEETFVGDLDGLDETFVENLRLGQELRFLLVCVGGGAARIGREIARKNLRYLETVVINCDARVSGLEEFDRRVCLGASGAGSLETGGSPAVGSQLARAAEPALERVFEGATFVTIVVSLGGGTGTGVLPYVLEAASRRAAVISVFAVKPFHCEGDRRALADRSLARLHFVDGWVDKLEQRHATLSILDNERLVEDAARLPMSRLNAHWAEVIATHIERAFVVPAEAAVEAHRLSALATAEPALRPRVEAPTAPEPAPVLPGPEPILPGLPALAPMEMPGLGAGDPFDAELTFEVIGPGARGPELP
jgi:hypothetical protein